MSRNEQELMSLLAYFYLQNNRPEKAETLLTALDIIAPDQPWTLSALAFAQISADHPDRCLTTLERLAQQGDLDQRFHLIRVQALSAQGRDLEASRALQSYLATRNASRPVSPIPQALPTHHGD